MQFNPGSQKEFWYARFNSRMTLALVSFFLISFPDLPPTNILSRSMLGLSNSAISPAQLVLSTLTSGTYLDCLCPVMFSWRTVKNHVQVQAVVALAVVAASEGHVSEAHRRLRVRRRTSTS